MYLYFKIRNNGEVKYKELPPGYSFKVITPEIWNIRHFFWRMLNLLGKRKFREYQILNEKGEVVSSAQVIGKIYKFPFMHSSRDIHIGPCYTVVSERGKGLYPILLSYIISLYPDAEKYMIVHEDNLSSLRGVKKAGFKKFAKGDLTRFKRYIITEEKI